MPEDPSVDNSTISEDLVAVAKDPVIFSDNSTGVLSGVLEHLGGVPESLFRTPLLALSKLRNFFGVLDLVGVSDLLDDVLKDLVVLEDSSNGDLSISTDSVLVKVGGVLLIGFLLGVLGSTYGVLVSV
jgi:hypothetical protein